MSSKHVVAIALFVVIVIVAALFQIRAESPMSVLTPEQHVMSDKLVHAAVGEFIETPFGVLFVAEVRNKGLRVVRWRQDDGRLKGVEELARLVTYVTVGQEHDPRYGELARRFLLTSEKAPADPHPYE